MLLRSRRIVAFRSAKVAFSTANTPCDRNRDLIAVEKRHFRGAKGDYEQSTLVLLRSRLKIVEEILRHHGPQMTRRVFPFANGMRPIRVSEHRKRLVVPNQFVNQQLGRLVVAVVIAGAVYEQQVSLQPRREIHGRPLAVPLNIVAISGRSSFFF